MLGFCVDSRSFVLGLRYRIADNNCITGRSMGGFLSRVAVAIIHRHVIMKAAYQMPVGTIA